MSISVKFFASLKEQQPNAASSVEGASTVAEVWASATGGEAIPEHVLCSVNLEHRKPQDAVADGDEVAFFPPVTGG